jgi:hypothetical protein
MTTQVTPTIEIGLESREILIRPRFLQFGPDLLFFYKHIPPTAKYINHVKSLLGCALEN